MIPPTSRASLHARLDSRRRPSCADYGLFLVENRPDQPRDKKTSPHNTYEFRQIRKGELRKRLVGYFLHTAAAQRRAYRDYSDFHARDSLVVRPQLNPEGVFLGATSLAKTQPRRATRNPYATAQLKEVH